MVRPGGRIALLDVATPPNPVLRVGHRLYFGRVVPLIGGLPRLTPAQRPLLSGGITQLLTATRA